MKASGLVAFENVEAVVMNKEALKRGFEEAVIEPAN
jgi:hypothetical protein